MDTVTLELDGYDKFVVAFSGGKDSLACQLHLIDVGVPREKVELWHYEVDGREGSSLMDWPCTPAYCRAVAGAFGMPIYFGWKVGGFEGEMLRDDAPTKPTCFETPEGTIVERGGAGERDTRLKYPQVAASLSARWCSAYLKVDVCEKMVVNQKRFLGKRVLIVGGERAEESANRAKYEPFEIDRADRREGQRSRRHVDRWLAVHGWTEREVWAIIERHRVNPHPAYRLGWGRVSCMKCIFGSPNQWASVRAIDPGGFGVHAAYEQRFGRTIHRRLSVVQQADRGTPYAMQERDIRAALALTFDEPIIMTPDTWTLPRGAFGESCGPT
jgi:3'-phosphoadenosine 5'-phosphosulfate sulfotransferase (PAPS reductase)/FAD synthetase